MTPRSIIHMVQLMLLKTERNAECDNETVVINIYFRFHTLLLLCYLCILSKKVLYIISNDILLIEIFLILPFFKTLVHGSFSESLHLIYVA